ncbi:MAG: hypothetical protein NNA20_07060, partial [Nitrospira sp.]|nr:hypothetical protein [Nitrospira sp.]
GCAEHPIRWSHSRVIGPLPRRSAHLLAPCHEHRFGDTDGFIITDDYNPLDRLQVRKAEAYRRIFLERIAFDLLIR